MSNSLFFAKNERIANIFVRIVRGKTAAILYQYIT